MDGVWSVHGGMHALAQCLARLGAQRGVQFRYGESVQTITTTQGRASGVQLASGETIAAQAVVFNGDVAALRAGLLGGGALPQALKGRPPERSLSAITWSISWGRASTWRREAISGTTPPKRACSSIWVATALARGRWSRTTAAADSSQLVSRARTVGIATGELP
jgi:phytoene dehydrogenase-like protein